MRFECDERHRADLAMIVEAPMHPGSSVAVRYLAVALLADLNRDSRAFDDAIKWVDDALAWGCR